MPNATRSEALDRNRRYLSALARVRERAINVPAALLEPRPLPQSVIDEADPELAQFTNLVCHKSGRPIPCLDIGEIRALVNGIGRDAALDRLQTLYRTATHPLWIQTDATALAQNLRADPCGFFVYAFARFAGWGQPIGNREPDWQHNMRARRQLYADINNIAPAAVRHANELMRRALALAEPRTLQALIGRPAVQALAQHLHEPERLAEWTSKLETALTRLIERHMREQWASKPRSEQEANRISLASLRNLAAENRGSSAMRHIGAKQDQDAIADIAAGLAALGFSPDKPTRPVLTDKNGNLSIDKLRQFTEVKRYDELVGRPVIPTQTATTVKLASPVPRAPRSPQPAQPAQPARPAPTPRISFARFVNKQKDN